MTTTIKQIENWASTEWTSVTGTFESDMDAVMAYLKPLAQQILTAAEAVGKATVQEGLQVLIDSAKAAVTAGANAAMAGQNPETAAEAAFVTVGASEGITAVHNAEAGLIKATVAAVQNAPAVAS